MISSKTAFLALIGNPVKHSLSPIMHNAVINHLNLDFVYLALPCEATDFEIVINALKKVNCRGLNITIPFKEKAFNICKEITPIAKQIKSVNTLKLNKEGEWIGTNTDVYGFTYPLKNFDLKGRKSTILGSGGAARSAIQGLINLELSEINVISRNEASLNKIKEDFKSQFSIQCYSAINPVTEYVIETSNIIVNSTPVGMNLESNEKKNLPFGENFWRLLNKETIVYDLIYNPKRTYLLQMSANKGCPVIDGSEMLIAQGAKSLSYWTNGLAIPTDVMRDSLTNFL